jgi:hypothetical protein
VKGKGKMNAKQRNDGQANANWKNNFGKACRGCYQKVLAQVNHAKDAILAEARATREVQEQLLRLTLNEAEALAFQTLYPQLVFPTLAVEKIQGAARWSSRQRQLA